MTSSLQLTDSSVSFISDWLLIDELRNANRLGPKSAPTKA
uniref:Uncharacterized protein n=1 Tax=Caenorhabditis japonica TaxID=281687 RepID=A0A8R1EN20_CAEJA